MANQPLNPQEIIDKLQADPAAYQAAARKEGEVWGAFFSDPDFIAARAADQLAAAELGLNAGKPGLPSFLRKHSLKPKRGLSLGCGSGRAERNFLQQGICETFTGVDVSEDAISQARIEAKAAGLNIDYSCQDINEISLDADPGFDLVICQNILHHVLNLEHVLDEVAKVLRPDGVFFVHDYIGETQFQFTDERLRWYNAALGALPIPMRTSLVTKKQYDRIDRPNAGRLASPFEAIRSGEISAMLKAKFEVVDEFESTTILDRVMPTGTRQAYLQDENTRAIFQLLLLLDRALLEGGLLAPLDGRYLLRKKSADEIEIRPVSEQR